MVVTKRKASVKRQADFLVEQGRLVDGVLYLPPNMTAEGISPLEDDTDHIIIKVVPNRPEGLIDDVFNDNPEEPLDPNEVIFDQDEVIS
jgi:hypothetical protein